MDWLVLIAAPRGFEIGPLSVQIGGMAVRRGPFWLPDGLNLWWGHRGVHIFWHKSQFGPRVSLDSDGQASAPPA